jgi:putative MATE family efflux protein
VDTIMVSHAGEAAVSGVSLVSSLDVLLLIFFTSMIGGGSVVLAQALGRNNREQTNEAAKQLLYAVTFLATILLVFVSLARKLMLGLLFGDAEETILKNAQDYLFFLALSYPFIAIRDSIGSCFRASGNTRVSLVVSIILNAVNVGLNAVLIYGCNMGASGAGLATFLARIVGAGIMIALILNKKHTIHIERLFHYKPDFSIIKKILKIGIPNGIENAMFQLGRVLTQSLISSLGSTAIAANAVALNISNYQYMTGGTFSPVMITVVGRCIGAKDKKQAKFYSRRLLFMNYCMIWAVIAFTLIFMNPLLGAYQLTEASNALAKQLIWYHAIWAALIWPIGFMLPSAFRAAGDVRFSMVVSMATMWIFRVFGGYICALETVSVFGLFSIPGLGLGIGGVWFAMTIDWVFRSGLFFYYFVRGKWLKKNVLE